MFRMKLSGLPLDRTSSRGWVRMVLQSGVKEQCPSTGGPGIQILEMNQAGPASMKLIFQAKVTLPKVLRAGRVLAVSWSSHGGYTGFLFSSIPEDQLSPGSWDYLSVFTFSFYGSICGRLPPR